MPSKPGDELTILVPSWSGSYYKIGSLVAVKGAPDHLKLGEIHGLDLERSRIAVRVRLYDGGSVVGATAAAPPASAEPTIDPELHRRVRWLLLAAFLLGTLVGGTAVALH